MFTVPLPEKGYLTPETVLTNAEGNQTLQNSAQEIDIAVFTQTIISFLKKEFHTHAFSVNQ